MIRPNFFTAVLLPKVLVSSFSFQFCRNSLTLLYNVLCEPYTQDELMNTSTKVSASFMRHLILIFWSRLKMWHLRCFSIPLITSKNLRILLLQLFASEIVYRYTAQLIFFLKTTPRNITDIKYSRRNYIRETMFNYYSSINNIITCVAVLRQCWSHLSKYYNSARDWPLACLLSKKRK